MTELSPEKLGKLLHYAPMLDKVEAALQDRFPRIVSSSVALQRDAGNEYADMREAGAAPVTQERVQETFGALYLAYAAQSEREHLPALQAMMRDLGLTPLAESHETLNPSSLPRER